MFWKGQEATISFHWFFGPIDVITLFESDEKRISGKVCLEINGSAVVGVENCKNLLNKKFCLLCRQHSGVPGKHQRRNIWVSYCRRHLHFQHLIVSQCSRRIVLNEATERVLMTFIIRGFFKSMFVWKQTWIEVSALNKLPLCYNWTFIKGSFLKLPEPLICHFNSTELLSKVGFRNYLNHSLTSSSLLLVFEQRKVTSSSVSMLHPNVVYQLLLYPKLTNYNKLKLESRSTGNLC